VHGTYELYDWVADYWELHDLYEERARLPEVAQLRAILNTFVYKYRPGGAASKPPTATGGFSMSRRRTFSAVEP